MINTRDTGSRMKMAMPAVTIDVAAMPAPAIS
jgi:hypothetical protein